ncbi:pseudoazurin [Roseibium denhamense]|uniref:Pseudoazurin n=1 Tax=Roseibium denhamense TaxID=76305 RepID=A0ABY1PE96_9HYPH|nr:pseudoazurin [Roseibium denhamense]MTI07820.1 pseudoazurin [Roseibium denhamense]SMP31919.1 pseudoazurin [Roseibium denhamense]
MVFHPNRRTVLAGFAGIAGLAAVTPAVAQGGGTVHDIQMLNKDPNNPRNRMLFSPRVLAIDPGDTVRFLPVDPGHNAQTIDGMVPEGAEGWRSKLNEEFEVTLTVPGIYGYKCLPHLGMGMVGVVFVRGEGMLENLELAQSVRQRGRAAKAFEEIWAEAEQIGLMTA